MDGGSFEDEMEVQDFEPLQRERSNTWHGDFVFLDNRSQQFSVVTEKAASARESENEMLSTEDQKIDGEAYDETSVEMVPPLDHGSSKKGSVRRNAWGNASYAELIAQAIESSPDKRLTLTQIYEWMINNNPYFQSRSDGPSSMGWKNSIRHNLSLHNQFSRVQNEGAGKSSWWVVNRNFVKCKLPSRRATMGDPALLDRKRSRVNKKLKGQGSDLPPNPEETSSAAVSRKIRTISEANETFIEIDQKSPMGDARPSKLVCASGITGSTDNLKHEISLVGEKLAVPENIEHLHWQTKETQDRDSNMTTAQSTLSYVVCSGVPLTLQPSQLGFPMNQSSQQQQQQASNHIILKVQQNKIQSNYFETNKISSPIVVYVAPPEKQNLIQSLDNKPTTTGSDSSRSLDVQNLSNISSIMMSDLNKQTNQMSLLDNQDGSQRTTVSFNISEKRRKMLMELLHSERFCQLRRQNPELNKKIIDMLQRKKNMLLRKGAKPYSSAEQCFESAERYLGILPENHQSDLGSYKLASNSVEIRPNVHHQNNFAGSILEKSDNFVDSFDFTQSNSFQVDIDQAIGDVDFDGNIDDLFGVNGLLINCEDELNSLAHDFTS